MGNNSRQANTTTNTSNMKNMLEADTGEIEKMLIRPVNLTP